MRHIGQQRAALVVHKRHATERHTNNGATVIGIFPADNNGLIDRAGDLPIAPHHAHDGVIGF